MFCPFIILHSTCFDIFLIKNKLNDTKLWTFNKPEKVSTCLAVNSILIDGGHWERNYKVIIFSGAK